MEMHQIRYFLSVCEHLNFTRAAEHCNVAQPSLTRAVKLLEEELGGALFHRERANTHLTELGQMIRPHLEQIVESAQATRRLTKQFALLKKTVLKLGIMCTVAPDQIIELIGSIQARHPGSSCSFPTQMPGSCRTSFSMAALKWRWLLRAWAGPSCQPIRSSILACWGCD